MILHPRVLPLLGGEVGPEILQLLGGDEGHLPVHQGQGGEGRKHRPQGGLCVPQCAHDGAHRVLEVGLVPVPGGQHLFPVPLVHVHGVEVVQLLVPADGVHVGIQPLAHGKLVAVQGQPLPFCQRVDHLRVPPGIGNVKGHRPLHAVQVVVQAGGRLHEQGRGHPAEVEGAAQIVLKQALQKADGLLGIIEVQTGGVPLWDHGMQHSFTPLLC